LAHLGEQGRSLRAYDYTRLGGRGPRVQRSDRRAEGSPPSSLVSHFPFSPSLPLAGLSRNVPDNNGRHCFSGQASTRASAATLPRTSRGGPSPPPFRGSRIPSGRGGDFRVCSSTSYVSPALSHADAAAEKKQKQEEKPEEERAEALKATANQVVFRHCK